MKKTSDAADNLREILDCIGRDSHTIDDEYKPAMGRAVRWLIQAHAAELQELIDFDSDWYDANVRPLYND